MSVVPAVSSARRRVIQKGQRLADRVGEADEGEDLAQRSADEFAAHAGVLPAAVALERQRCLRVPGAFRVVVGGEERNRAVVGVADTTDDRCSTSSLPPDVRLVRRPGKVLDLMAALNESVQQAKASRGEDADVHEMPKKKTTKKQSAKKAAAKKTTKMTPGRRPRSA